MTTIWLYYEVIKPLLKADGFKELLFSRQLPAICNCFVHLSSICQCFVHWSLFHLFVHLSSICYQFVIVSSVCHCFVNLSLFHQFVSLSSNCHSFVSLTLFCQSVMVLSICQSFANLSVFHEFVIVLSICHWPNEIWLQILNLIAYSKLFFLDQNYSSGFKFDYYQTCFTKMYTQKITR